MQLAAKILQSGYQSRPYTKMQEKPASSETRQALLVLYQKLWSVSGFKHIHRLLSCTLLNQFPDLLNQFVLGSIHIAAVLVNNLAVAVNDDGIGDCLSAKSALEVAVGVE